MAGFKIRELMVNVLPQDGWRMDQFAECPVGSTTCINSIPLDPCGSCTTTQSCINTVPIDPCGSCTTTQSCINTVPIDPCGGCTNTASHINTVPIPRDRTGTFHPLGALMAQMKLALDAGKPQQLH